jgi:hypothetical protein
MVAQAALLLAGFLQCQGSPETKVIHPLSTRHGELTKFQIIGLDLPEGTKIRFPGNEHKILRCFHSRTPFKVPDKMDKLVTGDTAFTLELTVPHGFAANFIPFYLETDAGKTATLNIRVDDGIVPEKEDNNGFDSAQPIAPNCILQGSIHRKQDVDTFAFDGKAGHVIDARIHANTVGSAMDPFLYLYDSGGHILAEDDDSGGKRDAWISYQLAKDGKYYLAVLDAHDFGDRQTHPYLLETKLIAQPLPHVTDSFPGGNIEVLQLDSKTKSLNFRTKKQEGRGWDCWWYFKMGGLHPGDTWELRLEGSGFTTPRNAAFSLDNQTWFQTPQGNRKDNAMVYQVEAKAEEMWFAWGPPFQLGQAKELCTRIALANVGANSITLCKSKDGHDVPALEWRPEGGKELPAIWIQARQHAWEAGSSWVCLGLVEWLASEDQAAVRLRNNAAVTIVPVMDVDNVERGAGGKNQIPHDHNRDWGDNPIHPEVAASQQSIKRLDNGHTFTLFLDLHNPAPGDKKPFFFGSPEDHMTPERKANQSRFLELCGESLGKEALGLDPGLRITGANYHPLWLRISKNWVARNTAPGSVCLTLETTWNSPNSTQGGYQAYGEALGKAIARMLE